MAAFVYRSSLEPVPAFPFFDAGQQTRTVAAFQGKVVLLNLWATWCGPCREEMPGLDRLQKELGSEKFEVVAVSVDRNGFDTAKKFLDGINVKSLGYYSDPSGKAPSQVKAIGMPATLLIDGQGREIGRLMGPAEWDSADAKRLIEAALR
jgi:thiol-disulfide isomerase/thioredoxin